MRFDPVECGKRIKALREEKRLTQMELAEQICITTDHLRAIERGRRACSIDLLVDLSLFFEVTLDHLILGRTPANEISGQKFYRPSESCKTSKTPFSLVSLPCL